MDRTGPKISSCVIVMFHVTPAEDGGLPEIADIVALGLAGSAGNQHRAFVHPRPDQALHAKTSDPIVVSISRGSPTITLSAAARATANASSWRSVDTSMRVGASQDYPVLFITAKAPSVTAAARSASGRMMLAGSRPVPAPRA